MLTTILLAYSVHLCGSAQAASKPMTIGVSLPTYHYNTAAVTAWERVVGRRADVVQTFIGWEYTAQPGPSQFPYWRAKEIAARGSVLEITWGPSNAALTVNQPKFSLASIAAGRHDAYVRQFANDVKRFASPVRLRFAHEMNGSWVSWSEARSGNRPGGFVPAWRHVHDVFRKIGVSNVQWVWSPNVQVPGSPSLKSLYPGDSYVDLVGLDGYAYRLEGCRAAESIFAPSLNDIRSFTRKPVVIAETGVSTTCRDRAGWVRALMAWIDRQPDIQGITWWERADAREDFRTAPYPDVREALAAAIARR